MRTLERFNKGNQRDIFEIPGILDWVAKLEVIPRPGAEGQTYDEQRRYWNNHTNRDEVTL
eukprot:331795-Prorocentrum_lima.AAC.1